MFKVRATCQPRPDMKFDFDYCFMGSSGTDTMREDVPRHTNCELEWTVCQVQEFAA